jgi:hypothetical protein
MVDGNSLYYYASGGFTSLSRTKERFLGVCNARFHKGYIAYANSAVIELYNQVFLIIIEIKNPILGVYI